MKMTMTAIIKRQRERFNIHKNPKELGENFRIRATSSQQASLHAKYQDENNEKGENFGIAATSSQQASLHTFCDDNAQILQSSRHKETRKTQEIKERRKRYQHRNAPISPK